MMYDGRIKAVETIKDGEQVMGDDNTQRNVKGVTSGKGPLYKVVPTTNNSLAQPFVCNYAHILVLKIMSGPCIRHHNSELRLRYFTYIHTTNLVQKVDKFYPYPSINYPTLKDAEESANHDLKLLDHMSSLVRPGFIWQPTVIQFLSCDQEVKAEAKMYRPREVKFSRCEGASDRIVERINIAQKHERFWGFEVKEFGIGDYYGFVVDGNHRFLLGDFTVTHNVIIFLNSFVIFFIYFFFPFHFIIFLIIIFIILMCKDKIIR